MTQKIEAPKEESCIDCRYFLADTIDEDREEMEEELKAHAEEEGVGILDGVCRRYPPVIILSYPELIVRHPDVASATDWCGEFTPKS